MLRAFPEVFGFRRAHPVYQGAERLSALQLSAIHQRGPWAHLVGPWRALWRPTQLKKGEFLPGFGLLLTGRTLLLTFVYF